MVSGKPDKPEHLTEAQIARLRLPLLDAACKEWGVSCPPRTLDLERRALLARRIHGGQPVCLACSTTSLATNSERTDPVMSPVKSMTTTETQTDPVSTQTDPVRPCVFRGLLWNSKQSMLSFSSFFEPQAWT